MRYAEGNRCACSVRRRYRNCGTIPWLQHCARPRWRNTNRLLIVRENESPVSLMTVFIYTHFQHTSPPSDYVPCTPSRPTSFCTSIPSCPSLLLQVRFHPSLFRLCIIVLDSLLVLFLPVARQARNGASNRTLHSALDSLAVITQLTLCLLPLAFRVLLLAFSLQTFSTKESA